VLLYLETYSTKNIADFERFATFVAARLAPQCQYWYADIRTTLIKGPLCAYVIRLQVSFNPNDEILSRNSLMYMRKANLPIAVYE